MGEELKKTSMHIMTLYTMAKLLHKEAQRAAEAKEYASYPVFMNRYHELYSELRTLIKITSLPIPKPHGWIDPANVVRPFWSTYLRDAIVAIGQMVAYLESQLGYHEQITSQLVKDIEDKLRIIVREIPQKEKEIQDVVENLLKMKEYEFEREKVSIPYSTKYYVPDFTFESPNVAMDIKLCDSPEDEKRIVDEINADIPAYKSKYNNLVFIVYDLGFIRDSLTFAKGTEKNNPFVYVVVIKH